jgi:predicted RNA-binding protein Jag
MNEKAPLVATDYASDQDVRWCPGCGDYAVLKAVQKALLELNTTQEQVEVEVIEHPQKGLFGLFRIKPAVVDVTLKPDPIEEGFQYVACAQYEKH